MSFLTLDISYYGKYIYQGQVLWAQIDANRHLRHSAYADFCAQARSNLLNQVGLSLEKFSTHEIGPILFKETTTYFKEVKMDEFVKVSVELTKYNTTNSRFSFRHVIYKGEGLKCATIEVDGAWMDLSKRKLTAVPADWKPILEALPKSKDYVEIS